MVITMAKLRMAHASTHSARKPPGPITLTEYPLSGSKAMSVEREKREIKSESGGVRIFFFN